MIAEHDPIEYDRNLLEVLGPRDPLCIHYGRFAVLVWSTTIDEKLRRTPVSREEAVNLYHHLGAILAQAEADDRVSQR